MTQKTISSIVIVLSATALLVGYLLERFMSAAFLARIPDYAFSFTTWGTIFVLGLLAYLFAPTKIASAPSNEQQYPDAAESAEQKKYLFDRKLLLAGLILFPFLYLFIFIGSQLGLAGGSVSVTDEMLANVLIVVAFLALPMSLVCLIVADRFHKKSDTKRANTILKIPFLYLVVVMILAFLS